MTESLRPSTVLPSNRKPYKVHTIDGIELVVEVAEPLNPSNEATYNLFAGSQDSDTEKTTYLPSSDTDALGI